MSEVESINSVESIEQVESLQIIGYFKKIYDKENFEEYKNEKYNFSKEFKNFLEKILVKMTNNLYESINEKIESGLSSKILDKETVANCVNDLYPGDATKSAIDYALIATDKFLGSKKSKKENNDNEVKKKQSLSSTCGLVLPVARFKSAFKKSCISKKTREDVHIFITGIIEWYASELMFQSLYESRESSKKTVTTDFLLKAIDTDDNLDNIRQFL